MNELNEVTIEDLGRKIEEFAERTRETFQPYERRLLLLATTGLILIAAGYMLGRSRR